MTMKASSSPKAEQFKTVGGLLAYAERHGTYYLGGVMLNEKKGMKARWREDGTICKGSGREHFNLVLPATHGGA